MHENFRIGNWTLPNDIAIITLAEPFDTSVSNVALLTLPPDNSNQFVGTVCTLSGWGRNIHYEELPDALQKVDMPVISTYECIARMDTYSGVTGCDDSQISVYDVSDSKGTCDGDSGVPLNCPLFGRSVVAGVGSFYVSRQGSCLTYYPSVFTRTGSYLNWIILNTPPSS
jgi:secreted trypsin-like serine protease